MSRPRNSEFRSISSSRKTEFERLHGYLPFSQPSYDQRINTRREEYHEIRHRHTVFTTEAQDENQRSSIGHRSSKNQTTEERHTERHPALKTNKIFSESGSALTDSASQTVPNSPRSKLTNLFRSAQTTKTRESGQSSFPSLTVSNEVRPAPRIKILDLHTEIENKPTAIDETSASVLKYKTPQFKSHVTFQMSPIDQNQSWKVGWIQACTHMEFFNTYGDYGYTSWEFPEMVTREKSLINDSDGRNYPWYGSSHQVVTISGPISHVSKYTVTMRDFFHPWIPWDIPTSDEEIPRLTHIYRNQHFLVWLAAMDLHSKDIYILRTVEWKKIIEINVDPKKQRGRRSVLVSDPTPEQPIIYDENIPIPTCALYPPTANSAQVLVWRPKSGQPTLVVPPKSIEINTANYAHLPLARY